MKMIHSRRVAHLMWCGGLFLAGLGVFTLTGCPSPGAGTGSPASGTPGTAGEPTLGILNILRDAAFSDAVPITILYSVPAGTTDVIAFYTLLNDAASAGGVPIGGEEVIAAGLPSGTNQSFLFDTTGLRPGFYQLGVRADGVDFLSQGTVTIQGPPAPLFLEPSMDVTVRAGEDITLMVDVGDPQRRARWRLFFQDADAPLLEEGMAAGGELLGVRLTEGKSNTVDFTWDTTNVNPGSYRLGLSATDSGFSISEAAAQSATSIVTAYSDTVITILPVASEAMPPTIQLTSTDQTLFIGDSFDIGIAAQTFEGDQFEVIVYSMLEGATDRTVIATITDPAVVSTTFDSAGLQTGVYEIGASISDGLNPVVEVPPTGRVKVEIIDGSSAKLVVSLPGIDRRVAQGESISIEWDTNIPPGEGRSFRVFARSCTGRPPTPSDSNTACPASVCTGADIEILSNAGLNITSTMWDTGTVTGWHQIVTELTLPELAAPRTACAPGAVQVSLTPVTVWTADLGKGRTSRRAGEVYQGVNFQDNAGTFLTSATDFDGDGKDDFIIGARFGKPFFFNADGVGLGEAYLIYGGERRSETFNLNETALERLRGIAFTGVLTRAAVPTETDGLSSVRMIPDQDGDGEPEIAFGLPFVSSRGHTRRLFVDQSVFSTSTLERPDQFQRGGVVFVSSRNTKLQNPPLSGQPDAPIPGQPVINLDLVGQNFESLAVELFPPAVTSCTLPTTPTGCDGLYVTDLWADSGMGGCTVPSSDGCFETFIGTMDGFSRALAPHLGQLCQPFTTFTGTNLDGTGIICDCFNSAAAFAPLPSHNTGGGGGGGCSVALGLRPGTIGTSDVDPTSAAFAQLPNNDRLGSGFYPIWDFGMRPQNDANSLAPFNLPLEPFGARIIGNSPGNAGSEGTTGDKFGSSIGVSGGFVIISAPNRAPSQVELLAPPTPFPTDPGIMYIINMENLWPDPAVVPWDDCDVAGVDGIRPPLPFQYQIGPFPAPFDAIGTAGAPTVTPVFRNAQSDCGRTSILEQFPSPFRILGEDSQSIDTIEGIADFNLDGREDFVVGAPLADGGVGTVNVLYRRDPFLEGDYILSKLALAPSDSERLAGLRLNGDPDDVGFGAVVSRSRLARDATTGIFVNQGIDFNGDGNSDLVIGNPNGEGGKGEIIIVFGTKNFVTPVGGMDVTTLLATNAPDGSPRAVRILGRNTGDLFGFNVAVAGDFNGDGKNDILVAAPGASPAFDSNDDGTADTNGIDVADASDPESPFGDNKADDIDGDGDVDNDDLLTGAGVVYLIFGNDNVTALAAADTTNGATTLDISTLGTRQFGGVIFVGSRGITATNLIGDMLGGGTTTRGTGASARTFRSFGVGPAGDVDGDGRDDILLGSMLAAPDGRTDAGEVYLVYGFSP